MSDPIRDETLIALLKERGYEVTRQEDDLTRRLKSVESQVRELKERPTPQNPEATFAQHYARALDRARSPWYSPGDEGGGSDVS